MSDDNYASLAAGISEDVFQTRILELCAWLRLKAHHETDSRKTRKGWPDLAIAGPCGFVVAELKKGPKHKPTAEQAEWLAALHNAGVRTFLWRPDDWPEINRVLHGIAGRRVPEEFAL